MLERKASIGSHLIFTRLSLAPLFKLMALGYGQIKFDALLVLIGGKGPETRIEIGTYGSF